MGEFPKSTEGFVNNFLKISFGGCPRMAPPSCKVQANMKIKQNKNTRRQTIEKWWNHLLPAEKMIAYWQVRALKHASDEEAVQLAHDVRDLDRGIVQFLKRRNRKIRKLRQQALQQAHARGEWFAKAELN